MHLNRSLRPVASAQNRVLLSEGRSYLNFSSNNYLGLASDPRVRAAFAEGLQKWGVGSGASRLITGDAEIFHGLEKELARFKGCERALLFNSGYQANIGALPALLGDGDVVFSDELNHASIIDGIRLSKARRVIFPHNNPEALRELLQRHQGDRTPNELFLIATESVFSMDGDLSPLDALADLAKEFDTYLYVDEAHATGVFGPKGEGRCANLRDRANLQERLIQMGTLGKALGCFGAYIGASRIIIEWLVQRARAFIFTTALPPACAAAALEALRIVQQDGELKNKLWQRTRELADGLGLKADSPILPWLVGTPKRALDLSAALWQKGFWVQPIRPPTVPEGASRLRMTVTAEHTADDVKNLIAAIQDGQSQN